MSAAAAGERRAPRGGRSSGMKRRPLLVSLTLSRYVSDTARCSSASAVGFSAQVNTLACGDALLSEYLEAQLGA